MGGHESRRAVWDPSESVNDVGIDAAARQQLSELENARFRSDTLWRARLAWWVVGVDSAWLAAVAFVLCGNASLLHLDASVLITLLATTTANVLGLAFIVLKGLYPRDARSRSL